jgi:rubrerythrin
MDCRDCMELFVTLESIEKRLEMLYISFANRFEPDADVEKLFRELARQEDNHARMVLMAHNMVRQNLNLLKCPKFDRAAVQSILSRVDELLRARDLDLQAAVQAALELENTAFESHTAGILDGLSDTLKNLLSSLRQSDRRHLRVLEEFARRRGIPNPVKLPPPEPGDDEPEPEPDRG